MKWIKHARPRASQLTLALAGTAVLLAACSGGGGASKPESAAGPAQTNEALQPKKREPVELNIFCTCGWPKDTFDSRFGDTMRKKFPEYQINYIQGSGEVTVTSLLTAGTKIDIVFESIMSQFSVLEQYKLERDMTDLVKKHNVDLNRIEPATIATIRNLSGGKLYAIPLVINTGMMYYNKSIFDKFGVAYPKNGMYWDEAIDLGKKINRTDGGLTYYGIGGAFEHIASISPLRVSFIDSKNEKPTIQSDPNWRILYNMITGIRQTTNNKSGAPETGMQSVSGINSFVKDQRLGMYMYLVNTFLNDETSKLDWWDMASYPYHREAPGRGQQPFATVFSVTSQSQHPDQAMEVLAGMLTDDVQKGLAEIGTVPAVQSAEMMKLFGTKSAYATKNLSAVFYNKMVENRHISKYDKGLLGIYQAAAVQDSLANGSLDLNTAFRQIEENAVKNIAEEKAKQ
ncbi:MAG: extracellular solute-binding protein family 1 [Paenibacillus sp.]|jgi:multiple sugar transport system substrate-binding protein|nr:extracellular solute-binding protein family 1 [Paenibacillus sp.]